MAIRKVTSFAYEEGQPDKMSDIIADTVLDQMLVDDPETIADIKVSISKEKIDIFGEVNTSAKNHFEKSVREVIREIGYIDQESGIDPYRCEIESKFQKQSQDISRGIYSDNSIKGSRIGLIYGYATNETPQYAPLAYILANGVIERLTIARKSGIVEGLLPDGQVMVVMNYDDDRAQSLDSIILASHHAQSTDTDWLKHDLTEKVIRTVCKNYITDETKIVINPSGRFSIGGPAADCGQSGVNIQDATWGGITRYSGIGFAGKDPSKIDRTCALMARHVAKEVVSRKMAQRCEIILTYSIGIADPLSIEVDTQGTSNVDEMQILDMIKGEFSFNTGDIIKQFDLRRPIYKSMTEAGIFLFQDDHKKSAL